MLATYKIVKSVNLPDQVGVNTNKGLLMINCEKYDEARPGCLLATYRGELADKCDLEVAIIVQGLDKFLVLVRDSDINERYWNDDYDEDDDEDEYREEDDEIFYKEADDENLLTVLGEAFATVEKELKPAEKKCSETVKEKPCKEKTLSVLRKLLDALDEED